MLWKLGDYTITSEDKYNFSLYKTVNKGTFKGVKAEGTKEKHIGYYGKISGALNKLINNELLEQDNLTDAQSILKAITALESNIELKFNIKTDIKGDI